MKITIKTYSSKELIVDTNHTPTTSVEIQSIVERVVKEFNNIQHNTYIQETPSLTKD